MSAQETLSSVAHDTKRKVTSREWFVGEMDRVIAWQSRLARIALQYTPAGRGRGRGRGRCRRCRACTCCSNGVICPTRRPKTCCTRASRCAAVPELTWEKDAVPDESTILWSRYLLE